MSTSKNKNCLRTIEAQTVQKLKNNEARSKFTGSYKKNKRVYKFLPKLNFMFRSSELNEPIFLKK